ncbi:MAG TPA: sarcosine oxidase subunit delta [Mesorhizobium sp.]
MRIACPFCGERENGEFTYLGDATPKRPAIVAIDDAVDASAEAAAFHDYVYLRDNIAGDMSEYWYHGGGCRSWLIVERNTLSHEILSVRAVPGAGAAKAGAK